MFSSLQKVKSTEDGPLGPGSDLLAALLGTFVLLAVSEKEGLGVRPNQMSMIDAVKKEFQAEVDTQPDGKTFRVFGGKTIGTDTIEIRNDATIQHFYFGGNILFEQKEDTLNPGGKEVVFKIGNVIRDSLSFLSEIQIQGHADAVYGDEYNLYLAARRAMRVFGSFKDKSNINPHENLMSITSFGEYKPVERRSGKWTVKASNEANDNIDKRNRNRRIEIILIYKTQ